LETLDGPHYKDQNSARWITDNVRSIRGYITLLACQIRYNCITVNYTPENKGDIGNESRHKWSHQIQRGNTLFPRSRVVWYTKGLNGQAKVLGVRKLEDITDADESGLTGEEGGGGLEKVKLVLITHKREGSE